MSDERASVLQTLRKLRKLGKPSSISAGVIVLSSKLRWVCGSEVKKVERRNVKVFELRYGFILVGGRARWMEWSHQPAASEIWSFR